MFNQGIGIYFFLDSGFKSIMKKILKRQSLRAGDECGRDLVRKLFFELFKAYGLVNAATFDFYGDKRLPPFSGHNRTPSFDFLNFINDKDLFLLQTNIHPHAHLLPFVLNP